MRTHSVFLSSFLLSSGNIHRRRPCSIYCRSSELSTRSLNTRQEPCPHKLYASLQESENTTTRLQEESEVVESLEEENTIQPVQSPEEHASESESTNENGFIPSSLNKFFQDLPPTSVLLLNMVAVLWGSQHAVIKTVVQDSDAGAFTLLRFGLAALFAAPYTPGLSTLWKTADTTESSEDKGITKTIWRWGAEMGFWMFLGFSFQAIGLEFTTAQKSGFLLYLNVKFVPFLARILLGREISGATWLSALTAFTGTALLAYSGSSGSFGLNVGDAWSIAAAVASAMFILRLESASAEVTNSAGLNAACLWVVTLLAGLWTVVQTDFLGSSAYDMNAWDQVMSIATSHPLEVLYLSGVTTALANWIQTKAQRDVSAERASVIYAMDPVYGAAFSSWVLGESLGGLQGWIGAGLITLAAATNAFLDLSNSGGQKIPPEDPKSKEEKL